MQSRMLVCDWQKQQYFSHVHFDSEWSHWEQTVIIPSPLYGAPMGTRDGRRRCRRLTYLGLSFFALSVGKLRSAAVGDTR